MSRIYVREPALLGTLEDAVRRREVESRPRRVKRSPGPKLPTGTHRERFEAAKRAAHMRGNRFGETREARRAALLLQEDPWDACGRMTPEPFGRFDAAEMRRLLRTTAAGNATRFFQDGKHRSGVPELRRQLLGFLRDVGTKRMPSRARGYFHLGDYAPDEEEEEESVEGETDSRGIMEGSGAFSRTKSFVEGGGDKDGDRERSTQKTRPVSAKVQLQQYPGLERLLESESAQSRRRRAKSAQSRSALELQAIEAAVREAERDEKIAMDREMTRLRTEWDRDRRARRSRAFSVMGRKRGELVHLDSVWDGSVSGKASNLLPPRPPVEFEPNHYMMTTMLSGGVYPRSSNAIGRENRASSAIPSSRVLPSLTPKTTKIRRPVSAFPRSHAKLPNPPTISTPTDLNHK